MKTIADFKRLCTLGSTWKTIYHKEFNGRDEKGNVLYTQKIMERPISIVQSTQIAFKTEKKDGSFTDSWISFPKSKECKIIDNNTIEIYDLDGSKLLTYQFIKGA